MNLFKAHHRWTTRLPDEPFWTMQKLHDFCQDHRQHADEDEASWCSLKVVSVPHDSAVPAVNREQGFLCDEMVANSQEELAPVGSSETPALLTHWRFEQLCTWTGAPPVSRGAASLADGWASLKEARSPQ